MTAPKVTVYTKRNCPYCVRAKALLEGRGIAYEEALAERIATIPAGRIGDPEEFGAACAYLCSAQAGFVTGQNLLLDGGAYPGTF